MKITLKSYINEKLGISSLVSDNADQISKIFR